MSCKTKSVYAPNGEKSILFQELVNVVQDENIALEMWASTRTPAFKAMYGDWQAEDYDGYIKLDKNGEPLLYFVMNEEARNDAEIYAQAEKKTLEYSNAVEKIVDNISKVKDILIRRIIDLEDSTTEESKVVLDRLVKLKKKVSALEWRDTTVSFSAAANTNIKYAETIMNAELAKTKPNTKKLRKFYTMLTAFDVMDQMLNTISSNEELSQAFSEQEILNMMRIIKKKNGIKERYKNYIDDKVVKDLAKGSGGIYTEEQVRDVLRRAPFDVTSWERFTRYAGDSTDVAVALVAKLINGQQQETRRASIEFSYNVQERLEALEKAYPAMAGTPEKLYAPMLEKNKDGELTGYVISEKSGEQWREFLAKYKGSEMMKFYEFFIDNYQELNDMLPRSSEMGYRLPSILKGTMEVVKSSKDKVGKMGEILADTVEANNLDTERGQILDDTNKVLNGIPIHYTQRFNSATYKSQYKKLLKEGKSEEKAKELAMEYAIREFPKHISYDLASSLQMFHYMANNYANMNEIIDVVEGARDLIRDRKVAVTNGKGDPILTRVKDFMGDRLNDNVQSIDGAESNSYKMVEALILTQVYGQTETDMGEIAIGNMALDKRKLIKLVQRYNSTLLMGLNIQAGTSNILMGEAMQWSEAAAKEFYSASDYLAAKKEYINDLPNVLGDVANRRPTAKTNLLNEYYDFLGDYRPDQTDSKESSPLKRVVYSGSIFFIQSAGEHKLQSQAAMAALRATKTYDSSGKQIGNLLDAHKVADGRLKIDDVYIKDFNGELVKYDKTQQKNTSMKIQAMLRRLHGNYNSQTAAEWQRNALLGLVGQFRKWIPDGIARRFDKKYVNVALQAEVEGSYRSMGRFLAVLAKDLGHLKISIVANWNKMSNLEKANCRRTLTEVAFVVAMVASLKVLKAMASGLDEDKDKKKLAALRFAQYQANRLMTELMFYTVVTGDTWEILKTPAASMTVIETTMNTLYYGLPWNWDERYQSGIHKDESKFYVSLKKQVPLWKQIERMSPKGLKGQIEILNLN